MEWTPIHSTFFEQETLLLSRALLGKVLVKETEEGIAVGKIVETEAYKGPMDRAAHSYGNRRTKRTEIMFGSPGTVYTYQMHTHCLVNVVSAPIDSPEAILIRAVEPIYGVELMHQRRGKEKKETDLTSGPGKLTKAFGITMEDYGRKFYEPPLYIAEGEAPQKVSTGPRIGIGNSGEAQHYPWRFWVTGNPFVSR